MLIQYMVERALAHCRGCALPSVIASAKQGEHRTPKTHVVYNMQKKP